ncbi:hypothetical protein [uncultured Desulfovibrio sp.]|uniref:hypothetical protein n=1 Tax=uncultured Desulfovibrio sp. TaxID=167968 RepID=UPI0032088BD4
MSDYLASYRLHGERIFRRIPALDMAGIGMLKLPGNNYYNFVTRKRFVKLISCAKEGVCVIKLH